MSTEPVKQETPPYPAQYICIQCGGDLKVEKRTDDFMQLVVTPCPYCWEEMRKIAHDSGIEVGAKQRDAYHANNSASQENYKEGFRDAIKEAYALLSDLRLLESRP